MEQRITKLLQSAILNQKGMVAVIGDTYTGKTFIVNKIIQKLGLRVIPYDFDTIPKGVKGSKGTENPLVKKFQKYKGLKVDDFFGKANPKAKAKEILFCDALETYSSSVLTFLKNVAESIPVIVTCDKTIVIPNIKIIERVWWNGSKRTPEGWEGDPILHTPRDLLTSLTQRRIPTNQAVRNFGSDSFILTQFYHDEFPTYKKADLDSIITSTQALSTLDMFRNKEWSSNGMISTTRASEELFVRTIRKNHKNPCLIPKGFFPKTLSKSGKITRNSLEIKGIETMIPNVRDRISVFNFKIGRSFAYKKEAQRILGTRTNEKEIESYSRALELTGNKALTKTEIKKLVN